MIPQRARTAVITTLATGAMLAVPVTWAAHAEHAYASTTVATPVAADTYTRSDAADQNYGAGVRWSVDGSTGRYRHAFLRFQVAVPPTGQRIAGATLRAFSDSASDGPGSDVYTTTSAWDEHTLTWNTEPQRGTWLDNKGGYASHTWVEWDVTAGVPAQGGTVSLELQTDEDDWLGFESRENNKGRTAELVVALAPDIESPPTTPPPTTPPPPATCNPSGQPMPQGDLPGWKQVFAEDFLTDVPIGEFPGTVYADKWGAYNDGWKDTTGNGTYMPSKVLSVQGCALDMYVHTESGVHMVSAATPKLPEASAYGKYEVRFRADALHGYKTAWLLWPDSELWPADGEIDWPEGNLDSTMFAAMHYADPAGGQDWFGTTATYPSWHTATTTWAPGKVTFALDGEVFGTSTTEVPANPMHWVLQTETSTDPGVVPADSTAGHVQVDWAVAYKASTTPTTPSPTTPPTTPPPSGSDIVLAAVGDANPSGNTSETSASALTATSIKAANPDALAFLGDFQYQYGSCGAYTSYFDQLSWGALMPKLIGTAGRTHDWSSASDLDSYRDHMAGSCPGQVTGQSLADAATGTNVGPDSSYMVDLGAWRVYSLSSALWSYDPTKANAATTWLDTALAQGQAAGDHAVVIMHEPYWTSPTGVHPAASTAQRPWMDLLNEYDVPLVLAGHQHAYERFYPQDAPATRNDATGTQEIVVGTGGIGFYPYTGTAANSVTKQSDTYGWLEVTLQADGHYSWQFVPTSGGDYTDSGSR